MRLVKSVCLLAMLALIASAATADKYEPNEKDWGYGPMYPRADYPEQEPNNTCPGPQQLQCEDRIVCGSYGTTNDDDFYQVYLTAGTLVSIGTDACQGSSVDTYLQLYDPNCAGPIASDDDSGPGLFSLISNFAVPSTGWYNIKTYSYSHLYTGNYILFVRCTIPTPPDPNDTCNPDIGIARCTEGVLEGDLQWDFDNYHTGSPSCTGYSANGKDVAYRLDLQAGDTVDLTYLQPNYDASFYIVTDCANTAGTCVIGADDTVTGEPEVIHWVVNTTGTYWLILDTYGTDTGGAWTLRYSITCVGEPTGACCVDGQCTITTEADCGGQWLGPDYPRCDPNPCAVPTRETSWGQIKSNYR